MGFLRQVRGEVRKFAHPLVPIVVATVAATICLLQARHVHDPYPGPSLIDVTGRARISALQLTTTLGFLLVGTLAGVGTAEEASNGSLAEVLLREPRRLRVALAKTVAMVAALTVSGLLICVAQWTTQIWLASQGTRPPTHSHSSVGAFLTDAGAALPVLVLMSLIALVIALASGSLLGTIALTTALFVMPLSVLQEPLLWATPTRWIVEWMHLDPFGQGVDYLADNSPHDSRGAAAWTAGVLIVALSGCLIGLFVRLIGARAVRPTERA